jgi:uracil-xanthine permease
VASPRPEDEKLSVTANLAYGFQHVLTMYGGIVAVPLIIGQAAGLSPSEIGLLITASLFAGGVATVLQTIGIPFFGCQLPLVQGVSFAGVATMVAIVTSAETGEAGIQVVLGAVMAAALIGFLITPIFSRVTRFFPPLVTGIVITTIGLTLMPVAARWAMGGNSNAPDFGSMSNIGLAGLTLAIVLLLSKIGNATISRLSILLAMVIGTGIAWLLGMTDFSRVAEGPVMALPEIFHFGWPIFSIAATLSMFIVIVVTLVETSADILAVGEILETKVNSRRLGDGLRADMASSILAPVVGSFTQSAFAQNVGEKPLCGCDWRAYSHHARPAASDGARDCLRSASRTWRRRHRFVWNGCRKWYPHAVKGRLSEQYQSDHRGDFHRLRHDPDCRTGILPSLPGMV